MDAAVTDRLSCYHCAEAVPPGEKRRVRIDGEDRAMCCAGCEAVARLIVDNGLDDFYRFRSEPAARVDSRSATSEWAGFDTPAVLDAFAPEQTDGSREIRLSLDNIRCAACGWLVENTVGDTGGVTAIQLNPVTGRTRLRWQQDDVRLSALLSHLDRLGFRPHPLKPGEQNANDNRDNNERNSYLKRLVVAGLGMMQVMMYAVALYLGAPGFSGDAAGDMDADVGQFLRYVSLLIATPVVFYSAAPFFRGAWRDLLALRPGMDLPIAIAIGAAYGASTFHVFRGSGEVYFDSVSMFVFFLLIGRFVEFSVRHRVAETSSAAAASLPASAIRFVATQSNTTETVPLTMLQPGDVLRVTSGSIVPADGVLLDDSAALDESLLTGEAAAVHHAHDAELLAGAINRGRPFRMRVTRIGQATFLSGITRLLENAQAARPAVSRAADLVARWFVGIVLLLASATALAWHFLDPARAFEITLAVLVVTCPCALALAVPVTMTAAATRLAEIGTLAINPDAIETLPAVTDIVFDKTGTLTNGKPRLRRVVVSGPLPEAACRALAAGLEAQANHPLAQAFLHDSNGQRDFEKIEQHAGLGITGVHAGRHYRIGTTEFVLGQDKHQHPPGLPGDWIVLGDDEGALAWFELIDDIRPEAACVLSELSAAGYQLHLLSGDGASAVNDVAARLHIKSAHARQSPEQKLARIRDLQQSGARVLMLGDGINDAPVLRGADASIAMGRGAALAQSSADFLLNGSLAALPATLDTARLARRIIRQNLAWALGYNALALPLAASGLVAPWMAAIGMSASSLLVTLNALRLRQSKKRRQAMHTQDSLEIRESMRESMHESTSESTG